MTLDRDKDMRDVAAAAASELGEGWATALDQSYPHTAHVAHRDGRVIRLTRSRRNSQRLAVQGVIRTDRQHRPVGALITIALDSSARHIASHIARRLLPAYTARFAEEMNQARRIDEEEARRDLIVDQLRRLGGDLDQGRSAAGRTMILFLRLSSGTRAWVEPGGETELRLRVSGDTAVRVMQVVTGQERS